MRFLTRIQFELFRQEFNGFGMAGLIVGVRLAECELPIVPRHERRREVGQPRYYADVWNFPAEVGRPGMRSTTSVSTGVPA